MNFLKCTKCGKTINNPVVIYGVLTCPHCGEQYSGFAIRPAAPFGISVQDSNIDPLNCSGNPFNRKPDRDE